MIISKFLQLGKVLAVGIAILMVFSFVACDSNPKKAAPPFDLAGSDAKAVALADSVLAACGGQENWDKTRIITWDWFGKRLTVWDKWTGDLRIESRMSLVLMNMNTMTGRAWKLGHEITEKAELKRAIDYGYEAWVNDSYWMLLPFKLKDGGVTLKYIKEDTTSEGQLADVISLTFKNVGLTPNNKFNVYIDKKSKLLAQWDFYQNAADVEPAFSTPWKNYQRYGNILLSNDRGDGPRKIHVGLGVYDALPATVFADSARIDWHKIKMEFAHSNAMSSPN